MNSSLCYSVSSPLLQFLHSFIPFCSHFSVSFICVVATELRTVLSLKLLPKCRCSHLKMFACVSSRARIGVLLCALADVLMAVGMYTWCTGWFSRYYNCQAGRFWTGVYLLKHLLNGTGTYVLPTWECTQFQTQPEELCWVCAWLLQVVKL